MMGRQSLVTPIDWKRIESGPRRSFLAGSRQSLVTPIDWKPGAAAGGGGGLDHVSPILGDAY